MLLGTHCPHCPAVLSALTDLVKQGVIASLEAVNLELKPEVARQLGVRTVPWVRIGWYELAGLHSKAELQQWAEKAGSDEGARDYFSEVLAEGKVSTVLDILKRQHQLMSFLLTLLEDADAKINVRLGVGAVLEDYAAEDWFIDYIPRLGELSQHADPRVRSDACHYLSLTGHSKAVQYVEVLLNDKNDDVKEVARESLEELNAVL